MREKLQGRLAELRQRREELIGQINACLGAIQEDEMWLDVLEKEEILTKEDPECSEAMNSPQETPRFTT